LPNFAPRSHNPLLRASVGLFPTNMNWSQPLFWENSYLG